MYCNKLSVVYIMPVCHWYNNPGLNVHRSKEAFVCMHVVTHHLSKLSSEGLTEEQSFAVDSLWQLSIL